MKHGAIYSNMDNVVSLVVANATALQTMKRTFLSATLSFPFCMALCIAPAVGQGGPVQGTQPVSYTSMTELNGMLTQLEGASKSTQDDLGKLRIERWKMDGGSKKQMLANVDSIQRNLQGALPEIISQLRAKPEDLPSTFKLYRNLDALYDVLANVVEVTGGFGSKDDFQSVSNDLSTFEGARKQLAGRIETLSAAKESEITRLRTDLRTAQAAIPATPPKKTVVDDNEPPKKPAVKKKAKHKTPPATTPGQTPPAQPQASPPKPQ